MAQKISEEDSIVWLKKSNKYLVLNTNTLELIKKKSSLSSKDFLTLITESLHVDVSIAKKINKDTFAIRTYERGVEAETLSCGTGATAVAIAMFHSKHTTSKTIKLHTQGGILQVRFEPLSSSYSDVWLCGPAKQVFKGDLEW